MRVQAQLAVLVSVAGLAGCSATSPEVVERPRREAVSPPPMPRLDVTDTAGNLWTSEQFRDKTVVVEFWATWCAPCREIAPDLREFALKNQGKLTLLSISLDEDVSAFSRHIQEHPVDHPVAWGGPSLSKEWAVTQMPALVLVRNGRILSRWLGKQDVLGGIRTISAD